MIFPEYKSTHNQVWQQTWKDLKFRRQMRMRDAFIWMNTWSLAVRYTNEKKWKSQIKFSVVKPVYSYQQMEVHLHYSLYCLPLISRTLPMKKWTVPFYILVRQRSLPFYSKNVYNVISRERCQTRYIVWGVVGIYTVGHGHVRRQ